MTCRTVADVLRDENISLGQEDRVNPPSFTPIVDGLTITVIDVDEETAILEEIVPFGRRTTVNEGLPAGETRLIQAGVNGVAQVTYRITYENGVEVNRSEIRRVLIEPPTDEILMVGSQTELPTITVEGTIVYIAGSNAWIVQQNSANRRPLTVDGDLDERVFALSQDGTRLLFTRFYGEGQQDTPDPETPTPVPTATPEEPTGEEPFNTLWAILDTMDPQARPARIELENILYAQWVPGTQQTIVYSTAEPRESFPGWQANNDLWVAQITEEGEVVNRRQLLEASAGGVYGFYGTAFNIAPDGSTLAWAQPDSAGVLVPVFPLEDDEGEDEDSPRPSATPTPDAPDRFEENPLLLPDRFEKLTRVQFAPFNAYDFIWRPEPVWSPDGQLVLTWTHGNPIGTEAPEDSLVFDLTAFPFDGDYTVDIAEQVGIFTYAQFAPANEDDQTDSPLAYLQAIDPLNQTTRYRLVILDRDGSNPRTVFPTQEESVGLATHQFAWSPDGQQIAVIFQNDIYLIDVATGLRQQLTGDGLSTLVRWAP
ncbi:MAG: G5 domain-containing protein [Anaerolineae bacterium]